MMIQVSYFVVSYLLGICFSYTAREDMKETAWSLRTGVITLVLGFDELYTLNLYIPVTTQLKTQFVWNMHPK
jgi:hypothetical protein